MQPATIQTDYRVITGLDGEQVQVHKDDDRQLRRLCCGSTDVPKIMGTSPYAGPYDLYYSKMNDEVIDVNPAMRMGLLMEPVMRQLAQESLGDLGLDPDDEVIEGETFYQTAFMQTNRSTPDALLKNNKAVCFEFKRHRYEMRDGYGDQMTNEVLPMEYDQVQWHMNLSGCEVCFVGVLFAGSNEMMWWRVERDDKRIEEIENKVLEFWATNLNAKNPPSADPTPGCLARLKKLEERDASRRTFEDDEWQMAIEYDKISKGIKEMEAAKKELEVKIREAIGEMQELYVEEGKSKVTCKAPKGRDTRTLRVSIKD